MGQTSLRQRAAAGLAAFGCSILPQQLPAATTPELVDLGALRCPSQETPQPSAQRPTSPAELFQNLREALHPEKFQVDQVITLAERLGPDFLAQRQHVIEEALQRLANAHRDGVVEVDTLLFWEATAILRGSDIRRTVRELTTMPEELSTYIEREPSAATRLVVVERYRRETARDPFVDFVRVAPLDIELAPLIARTYGLHTRAAGSIFADLVTQDFKEEAEFGRAAALAVLSVHTAVTSLAHTGVSSEHVLRNIASATEAALLQHERQRLLVNPKGDSNVLLSHGDYPNFRAVIKRVRSIPALKTLEVPAVPGARQETPPLPKLLKQSESLTPTNRNSLL